MVNSQNLTFNAGAQIQQSVAVQTMNWAYLLQTTLKQLWWVIERTRVWEILIQKPVGSFVKKLEMPSLPPLFPRMPLCPLFSRFEMRRPTYKTLHMFNVGGGGGEINQGTGPSGSSWNKKKKKKKKKNLGGFSLDLWFQQNQQIVMSRNPPLTLAFTKRYAHKGCPCYVFRWSPGVDEWISQSGSFVVSVNFAWCPETSWDVELERSVSMGEKKCLFKRAAWACSMRSALSAITIVYVCMSL